MGFIEEVYEEGELSVGGFVCFIVYMGDVVDIRLETETI